MTVKSWRLFTGDYWSADVHRQRRHTFWPQSIKYQ